ncbi:UPF0764 protein C16orf89 homolog isoform X2 [Tribolium madens]|uniref:UPF0764 protein C16orf89 homolog isoform X2 n=1 Tax=Tribolium madens TaxID=41895 RepID=UPI001CF72B62|nr:UPF0764 protein C16orf89 homolog isoform X2 [Tribolium madens]
MWKRLYFAIVVVCLPVLSKISPDHVIDKVLDKLGLTLDYISQQYEIINVDCLFGVVLAGAIIDDTVMQPGPYRAQLKQLKNMTGEIFAKTAPLMQEQPSWNYFARHVVVPELWPKPIRYKFAEFRMAYARESRVKTLFSKRTYENYTEGFSDQCLSLIVNSTLDIKGKKCRLSPKCQLFVENLEKGAGYILTHKLLLLQVARVRQCKMSPKSLATAIKKVCAEIYTETISAEYFVGLEEIFDLFLEQSLLCGYEGYADFLKFEWLEKILQVQHDSGCFPVRVQNRRRKRETNEFEDGCADHTTGLGAAVLSLYLNYLIKNADNVVLASEWF